MRSHGSKTTTKVSPQGNSVRKRPRSTSKTNPADIPVGVVGLGLMGTSIVTCLLAAGHPVVGVSNNPAQHGNTRRRVLSLLRGLKREKLLSRDPGKTMKNLLLSGDYSTLSNCQLVFESVKEDLAIKQDVFRGVEAVVAPDAIIGSNTSAIPVTDLQKGMAHPERILGIHWGEPAHVMRFMEIICGHQSDPRLAERVRDLARAWDKDPSVVKRDIRGFLTNRCMYALMREAFYLVDQGYATIEDVDRSVRNDLGYWITLAGPFRILDLCGIPGAQTVVKDLYPELCNSREVPEILRKTVASGALGVANAKGFYEYTPAQARQWEKRHLEFTYDIRALALKYSQDAERKSRGRKPQA
jgi:3-hydroxybutyryl-CoA dehydrogenase